MICGCGREDSNLQQRLRYRVLITGSTYFYRTTNSKLKLQEVKGYIPMNEEIGLYEK